MLIVIADDFTGAAEMAGIAHSSGLKVVLQNKTFEFETDCDVLVIDADTRSKSEKEACQIITSLCQKLVSSENLNGEWMVFKKTDSVFRGHFSAELEVMSDLLAFNRILALPANPSMGRTIQNGQYFIGDKPLHLSSFADDPDFTKKDSNVSTLLDWKGSLPHIHLAIEDELPEIPAIFTVDILTIYDIEKRLESAKPGDLVCGSGDAFRAFISKLHDQQKPKYQPLFCDYLLILNGSTHDNSEEKQTIKSHDIPIIYWKEIKEAQTFVPQYLAEKKAAIYTSNQQEEEYDYDLKTFAKSIVSMVNELKGALHLVIIGGATARSIMDELHFSCFEVVEEVSSGVVTMSPKTNQKIFITTKPGSYPWMPEKLSNICKHTGHS
ncbi:MAG: four-carbon acid sugar kinase family protein [Saprospiraceae bacterium]|nr:four-carbon acid sugar kinase family protein [Saprospiraceae bacterium]